MGIANSFAAGVFIAIALIHILPEAMETWDGV
jgi:zinc transporter ZupT